MTTQTKQEQIEAEQSKANQNGAKSSGYDEVVSDVVTRIPLAVVYGRLEDLIEGDPQGAKVEKDAFLTVSSERRQRLKK